MAASPRVLRHRRYVEWVAVALLVAWCASANTFAAAESSSASAAFECDGPVPFYTAHQVAATRGFLAAFTELMYPMSVLWQCSNFCTWDYVSCKVSGVEVDLNDVGVLGEFPALPSTVVGADVVVTKMDFSNNEGLSEQLPTSWSALTQLRHFATAFTGIGGSMPASWAALSNLESVDVRGTQIMAKVPESWKALTKLQVLRASGTNIGGTLPASWSAMKALTELDMGSCSLTGTLPESWSALSKLETLRVNDNALNGSIPESYGSMSSIATVNLRNNRFCGCLPSAWTSATSTVHVTADAAVEAATCSTANSCFPISLPSSSSSSWPAVPSKPSSSSSSSQFPTPPPACSSSSSSDGCAADVPYFTPAQVKATRTVLTALGGGFAALKGLWQRSNFCTWFGVTCSDDGVRVSLHNQNLVGTLPPVPAGLEVADVMLISLDLSNNLQLTGSLPNEWLSLPNLAVLNVSNCGLSGALPQ